MATSSVSSPSSTQSLSDTLAPVTFNGASSFSSSFQQVFQRAIQIASLPLTQLQNTVSDMQSQQATLMSLQGTFGALQKAITDIGSSTKGSLSAVTSDPSIVSANVTSSAFAGTYSIEVDSLGSSTTTLSKGSPTLPVVTDPTTTDLSTSTNFTLTINGVAHSLSGVGTSMTDLATAINGAALGVQATVVNLGSTSNPDYRLAVTSNNLASDTIQLNDGTNDLLDTLSTGSAAQYKVAGNSTVLTSSSRQVTLAPGLTVTMLGANVGQNVSVTVGATYSNLSNNLNSLATAYNAAVDAVAAQHGTNAGFLQGQSVLLTLSDSLRQISQFTGSGSIQSLTDVGLNLDSTGHLTFDPTKFASQDPGAVQQFLGSVNSGGLLKTANDALNSIDDSTTGVLQSSIKSLQSQITEQNNHIAEEQLRVTNLQTNLEAELTKADAAVAALESQKSYFSQLFTAENTISNSFSGVNSTTG
jgi:flagellar hook-associated protein 2